MNSHVVYVVATGRSEEFNIDSVWTAQSAAESRFKAIVLARSLFSEPVTLQKWRLNGPDGGASITEVCSLCWSTVPDTCSKDDLLFELIDRGHISHQ